jgi:hypothetical protein
MGRGRGRRQRQPRRDVASSEAARTSARSSGAAPSLGEESTRATRWATLAVVVAALIAFGGSLRNQFTYDEGLVIGEADGFLRSASLATLVSPGYFAASREGTYRPVVTLSYMVDRAVSPEPLVFKLQSLLWHIACALLVLQLARRLLPAEQRRYAVVAGLLFALHPLGTETVDNASFREDALVTFFTVAGLLLAWSRRLPAAVGCYVLALLSKESAVVMPALLLMGNLSRPGDAARGEPGSRRRSWMVRESVVLGTVTLVYLAIRFGPMNTPGAYASFPGGTRAATLLEMPAVFAHYLRLLVVPWPLCADYTGYFDFGPQPWAARVPAFLLLAAFVTVTVTAYLRRQRLIAFALGWFALALLPVSNIIPVPVPAAERFLYLPLVGVSLALAATLPPVVARWPRGRTALLIAGAGVAIAFVVVANLRHGDWHDNDRLWAATARVNPRSCGAQSAMGGARLREGIHSRAPATLAEGVALEELALRLCPPDADPPRGAVMLTRLGAANAVLGQLNPARQALDHAIRLSPRDPLAVVWLGYVQFMAGDKRAAEASLRHAVIDLGPPNATVAQVASQYMDKL